MFEHKQLKDLEEYFLDLDRRAGRSVFFYRINGYNETIKAFIQKYYETARRFGIVIEGRIPNPTEQNLAYYSEIMGMDFKHNMGFFTSSLKKWLPRMNDDQREQVAGAIYDTLELMRRGGKTENMLKNAYIKFMCWMYYRFERILNQLGSNQIPKILYEGEISNYELKLITILSNAGCDVLLLQYHGDTGYLALDAGSEHSFAYPAAGLTAFPENFSISQMREEMERGMRLQRIYGPSPGISNCTNAWISGNCFQDILKGKGARGEDDKLFYNCFCRVKGAEDKLTYLNELYQFYLQLKNEKRNIVVVNQEITKPSMDEISGIRRNNYSEFEQMAADLCANIEWTASLELQKLMRKAFVDVLVEEYKIQAGSLNRLTNRAIYLLCWLKRYQSGLFSGWKQPQTACFIYMGGCRDENESLFLRMLSRLPVDILILVPDLNTSCKLEDRFLYEVNYQESLPVEKFPTDQSEILMGTMAYHAERELDTIMYQDSGIYRNQQCGKAMAIVLQTMYEEIELLWDQELKYRPNFSVVDGIVNVPVLFAKVSGVKEGDVHKYWADIKKLVTEDTFVVKRVPYCSPTDENPIKQYATEFIKNRKLLKNKIKSHKSYQYGVLRDEVQDHILNKLQLLLDLKSIRGTYENGTEYTIVATVLNLNKEIVRLIQKFDFTRKNPKMIYINTTERMISLEDSIIAAFLSLAGFDIVFFIPTGYQTVENHFNQKFMEEHQIGEYVYDLQPPDFNKVSSGIHRSWREKIFKRGN